MPLYLKAGDGKLLVLSRDSSTLWTSIGSFGVGRSTGIACDAGASPPVTAAWGRGPMMTFVSQRFFVVSGTNTGTPSLGNKCVSTVDGITVSAPSSLPIQEVTGIASNNPVT